LQLGILSGETLILGAENLLIIFLASNMVSAGELTLGQMMSFIFLKQHFLGSVLAMIPKLGELRLMRLELDRVADIRLAELERGLGEVKLFNPPVSGHVQLHNVTFKYPGAQAPILNQFTAEFPAEKITALSGPSGCGKSTLLKLVLGLESLQSGELTIDGWDHSQRCPRRFREQVAALLHDENLLAGTLAFNVNLGIDGANQQRLEQACADAGIADLIATLPMGYATRVGELGSQFSAGQIRRILIARAFYRGPSLILLDETLTHLGQQAALQMLDRLRSKKITSIVVSHDPAVLAAADHRVSLVPTGTNLIELS
jgi:ATP-binding cassette subfamily B protein RaxB